MSCVVHSHNNMWIKQVVADDVKRQRPSSSVHATKDAAIEFGRYPMVVLYGSMSVQMAKTWIDGYQQGLAMQSLLGER